MFLWLSPGLGPKKPSGRPLGTVVGALPGEPGGHGLEVCSLLFPFSGKFPRAFSMFLSCEGFPRVPMGMNTACGTQCGFALTSAHVSAALAVLTCMTSNKLLSLLCFFSKPQNLLITTNMMLKNQFHRGMGGSREIMTVLSLVQQPRHCAQWGH